MRKQPGLREQTTGDHYHRQENGIRAFLSQTPYPDERKYPYWQRFCIKESVKEAGRYSLPHTGNRAGQRCCSAKGEKEKKDEDF
jgi:hypothetical protein